MVRARSNGRSTAIAAIASMALASTAFAAGAPSISWQASDGAGAVAFSKDGSLVADSGGGVYVTIRNAASGALVRQIRDKSGINTVAFSPSGALVAEGRTNGSSFNAKVYRVSDGMLLLNLPGHSNATRSVQFSPDGTLLASGGDDKNSKLYRVSDGVVLRTLSQGLRVRSVAFAPNGTTLAAGDQGGTVKLWRVSDGALQRTLSGFTNMVSQVVFSPDGTLVAASSLDGTTRLWHTSDGGLVRVISLPPSPPLMPNGSTSTLAFTPNGATLVTGNDEVTPSPEHGTLRFYRVSDGALLGFYDQQTSVYVSAVAYSPLGSSFVYSRSTDGVVTLAASPF